VEPVGQQGSECSSGRSGRGLPRTSQSLVRAISPVSSSLQQERFLLSAGVMGHSHFSFLLSLQDLGLWEDLSQRTELDLKSCSTTLRGLALGARAGDLCRRGYLDTDTISETDIASLCCLGRSHTFTAAPGEQREDPPWWTAQGQVGGSNPPGTGARSLPNRTGPHAPYLVVLFGTPRSQRREHRGRVR
jgi:hypothetical protein